MYFSMLNSNIFTSLYWHKEVENNIHYIYTNTKAYRRRDSFIIPNLGYKNAYYIRDFSIYVIESVKYDLYSIFINFNIFRYVLGFLKILKAKNNFMYYSNYLGKYECELLSFVNLFIYGENVRRRANLSLSRGFINIYDHFHFFNMYNRFSRMYDLDGDNLKDLFIKRKILYQIKNEFGEEKNANIKHYFDLLLNLLQVLQDKYMNDVDISKYRKYFEEDKNNKADLFVSSTLFYNTGNIFISINLKLNKGVAANEYKTKDIVSLSLVLTPQGDFYCYRDMEGLSRYSIEDEDIKRIKKEILKSNLFIKNRYRKIILK